MMFATTACGSDTDGGTAAPAALPSSITTSASPAAAQKSKKEVCEEAEAASRPFFQVTVEDAPTVAAGEALPPEYVDDVHGAAREFARELHSLAADSTDGATREAFEKYADRLTSDLVESADLSAMTPENSDWLLSLGEVCQPSN